MNNEGVNSKSYWDKKFKDGWGDDQGNLQGIFYSGLTVSLLPEWFKRYLGNKPVSFLDWGCAEGSGTKVLHDAFPKLQLTGIDFSETAIKKANTKRRSTTFESVDLLSNTQYAKTYDVVYSSNVLEHFHDPWAVFRILGSHASDFVVAMVPFRESPKDRMAEHFYSFTPKNIPAELDSWLLVYLSVKDTETLPDTSWSGQQALMIFAKAETVKRLKLSAADMSIWTEDPGKAKGLEDQIATMQTQLDENWRHMQSSRYKAADKVIDAAHKVLPMRQARKVYKKIQDTPEEIRERLDAQQLRKIAKRHRGVIVHTGIPWDEVLRQRPHHMAPRLAAGGYLFIYVDPEADSGLRRWISPDLLVVGGYDVVEKLSTLKGKMPLYYISIAGFPSSFDELKAFKDNGFKIVYEYIDELHESINGSLSKQIGVFKNLEKLEPVLVIVSASRLYDAMAKRFSKKKILLSQNAVDIEKFQPTERTLENAPEDMQDIIKEGKPIVGYYGAIASWLDYELINDMVLARPEYNFVFIGRDYDDGLKRLQLPKNMHYLGPKDYDELASYSYWFDCALVPFQKGEIAKSTSPLKLFEYMAMGLPTVCTRDLRECSGYDGVLMSKDNTQFIANVDKAIVMKQDQKVRSKLISYAKQNTWDARAKDILNALHKMEG